MSIKSMEFFKPNSNVNFMGVRKVSVSISLLLILASIVSLSTRGLNFALDFTGGSLVEVTFAKPVEQADISKALEAAGIVPGDTVVIGRMEMEWNPDPWLTDEGRRAQRRGSRHTGPGKQHS